MAVSSFKNTEESELVEYGISLSNERICWYIIFQWKNKFGKEMKVLYSIIITEAGSSIKNF